MKSGIVLHFCKHLNIQLNNIELVSYIWFCIPISCNKSNVSLNYMKETQTHTVMEMESIGDISIFIFFSNNYEYFYLILYKNTSCGFGILIFLCFNPQGQKILTL